MGIPIPFRRRRPELPPRWARYVRQPAFTAEQIRLAIWSGLLLGLLLFEAMPYWPAPGPAAEAPVLAAVDPYAEARRSRAILEAQERAPPPVGPAVPERGDPVGAGGDPVAAGGYVRVIDGDTFVYAGTRIRIADIDTPEVHGRCPSETALAARATARTRQLLAPRTFELHPLPSGRDEDRYGRKLRIVTVGGRSVGDVLVAEGLARTWSGRREGWC
ncbi:MAG TPA: thermonuclease family protein [Allosphingosinicella sp.]|jgi:endonuclease YncB( thermonuclease family)